MSTQRLADEATIFAFVQRFYQIARADDELGPLFEAAITDWDRHMAIFANFWATALLGAKKYEGTGYAPHIGLPIEEHHFTRWLAALDCAGKDVLPPELAERSMARARHMAMSFKTGLLPFKRADGTWSRTPE